MHRNSRELAVIPVGPGIDTTAVKNFLENGNRQDRDHYRAVEGRCRHNNVEPITPPWPRHPSHRQAVERRPHDVGVVLGPGHKQTIGNGPASVVEGGGPLHKTSERRSPMNKHNVRALERGKQDRAVFREGNRTGRGLSRPTGGTSLAHLLRQHRGVPPVRGPSHLPRPPRACGWSMRAASPVVVAFFRL